MNGFDKSPPGNVSSRQLQARYKLAICLVLIASPFLAGCEKPKDEASIATTQIVQHDDGITASRIVNDMLKAYSEAEQYSDKGVLYMSYRMDGRPMQEPQPWAVSWNRENKMAMELFNSQIRYDGSRLSCYVFDIDSGNLDNQHLIIDSKNRPPVNELYRDEIASHFIAGHSELPLVKSYRSTPFLLVPPAVGLLSGQMTQSWLHSSSKLQRLADEKLDTQECYVVRFFEGADEIDVWIDKESKIIWQADFPTHYLDEKVRNAPEVTQLRLIARFHMASFSKAVEKQSFDLKARSEATAVTKFVSLPEALASEVIGMKSPRFTLQTVAGKEKEQADFTGKTAALLWIAGQGSDKAIQQFNQIKTSLADSEFDFGVVYSDIDLADLNGTQMNAELATLARNTKLPFYFDRQLATSTQLRMKSVPAVVVFGPDSKVQFARTVTDGWASDVKAAMKRVAAGDDVASEMLANYQQFLEKYHNQLLANSAKIEGNRIAANPASHRATSQLNFNRVWNNPRFKSAGNVVATRVGGEQEIHVLDGWRTVTKLNGSGRIVSQNSLDLPDSTGVSKIDVAMGQDSKPRFVVYMPDSEQAFIFDEAWETPVRIPSRAAAFGRIRSCCFVQASDGGYELVTTFGDTDDVKAFNIRNGVRSRLWKTAADSIHGGSLLATSAGRLIDVREPEKQLDSGWDRWRIVNVTGEGYPVCIGSSKANWFAIGVGKDRKPAWSVSIGEQLYETPLNPVDVSEDQSTIAIANSRNEIHLLTRDGKWLGDFKSDKPIKGFSVSKKGSKIELIVASTDGVSLWAGN